VRDLIAQAIRKQANQPTTQIQPNPAEKINKD